MPTAILFWIGDRVLISIKHGLAYGCRMSADR
jgi:hypothetical protein